MLRKICLSIIILTCAIDFAFCQGNSLIRQRRSGLLNLNFKLEFGQKSRVPPVAETRTIPLPPGAQNEDHGEPIRDDETVQRFIQELESYRRRTSFEGVPVLAGIVRNIRRFQACITPKSDPGHCRHVQHCVLPAFLKNINTFLSYSCFIGGVHLGVCCPDRHFNQNVDEEHEPEEPSTTGRPSLLDVVVNPLKDILKPAIVSRPEKPDVPRRPDGPDEAGPNETTNLPEDFVGSAQHAHSLEQHQFYPPYSPYSYPRSPFRRPPYRRPLLTLPYGEFLGPGNIESPYMQPPRPSGPFRPSPQYPPFRRPPGAHHGGYYGEHEGGNGRGHGRPHHGYPGRPHPPHPQQPDSTSDYYPINEPPIGEKTHNVPDTPEKPRLPLTLSSTTTTTTTTTRKPTTSSTTRPTAEPVSKKPEVPGSQIQKYSSTCGLSVKSRIVGGEVANGELWSWVAALMRVDQRTNTTEQFCGGVIISNRYIVTAAHCLPGIHPKDLTIRLGEYDFSQKENSRRQDFKVSRIVRHPAYNESNNFADIALVKVSKDITFSQFLLPVCMPDDETFAEKIATVIGWGVTSFGGPSSSILMQLKLPVWSNQECQEKLSTATVVSEFLCAGLKDRGGHDSCQGDSGGPLMVENNNEQWSLIGVVSWGFKCAQKGIPAVYTRVSNFRNWIYENAV